MDHGGLGALLRGCQCCFQAEDASAQDDNPLLLLNRRAKHSGVLKIAKRDDAGRKDGTGRIRVEPCEVGNDGS
ncbi:hypothetical protein PJL18_04011 [Paenarthrobacter nicotinovorans]|nr:hypothetical protein [Paenarthrobacter nicotinovorans]